MSIICARRFCSFPVTIAVRLFGPYCRGQQTALSSRIPWGHKPLGGGRTMKITKTIATSFAAFAILTSSALAADIVRKAPMKKAEAAAAPASTSRSAAASRATITSAASRRPTGPGRLGLCRAALQHHQGHPALRRHLGLEHQAPDHADRRVRHLRRHPAHVRPVRVRLRRHVLLLPARDAAVLRRSAVHHGQPTNFGFGQFTVATPTCGRSTAN